MRTNQSGRTVETMVKFEEWCKYRVEVVNGYDLNLLSLLEGKFDTACERVAVIVPSHYAFPERIVDILKKFGKLNAAKYLQGKLPQTQNIRSGDLGEILATQYMEERTLYEAPIKRLRWKDHREMSMRGEDVIGVALPDDEAPIKFIKSEVKSRASLSMDVVREAREALNNNSGLPSPHALTFISDRLYETGQDDLADLIINAQLNDGISNDQVEHLLFTFTGNIPDAFLKADLKEYDGPINQNPVGLHVKGHQKFIAAVYEAVDPNYEP